MNIKSAEAKKNIAFVLLVTLWFVYFTGGKFINPFYIDWIFPSDTETHWLGWQFFKNQSIFNFPLFKNINYGMELGSSLVLNDSLAIMAMIFKPFAVFIPFEFQYFGLWTYICFLLQGIITMKIFHIYTKNKIIILLCGFFFTMLPPFLWRLHGHFGLLGHWLILYAFFIYLSSKEINLKHWIILVTISLLINAYIAAMIIGIFIADLIKYKLSDEKITFKILFSKFFNFIFVLLVSLFVFGYFMVGKGAGGKGFGKYNANLNSFFDPDQIWSIFITNQPTPEFGYEGFAFPGTGILIMILIGLISIIIYRNKINPKELKHFSPLIVVALLAYLFALSNNITLGTDIIAKYEVPSFLIFLTKIFRSSGRFVWILFYLVSISSLIFIIKNYSDKTIKVLLILLITIQFIDLSNAREYFSTKLNTPKIFNGRSGKWKSPMKNIIWNEISKNYNKVSYVYTKNRPKDYFPISYFAAENDMKINTGYFSRVSKEATKIINLQLKKSILTKKLNHETIYFIYDDSLWDFIKNNYDNQDYIIEQIDSFRVLGLRNK